MGGGREASAGREEVGGMGGRNRGEAWHEEGGGDGVSGLAGLGWWDLGGFEGRYEGFYFCELLTLNSSVVTNNNTNSIIIPRSSVEFFSVY